MSLNKEKTIKCDECKEYFPEEIMGTVNFRWLCPNCYDEIYKTTNERPNAYKFNMEN